MDRITKKQKEYITAKTVNFTHECQKFIQETKQMLKIKNDIRQLEKTIEQSPDNFEALDKLQEANITLEKSFPKNEKNHRLQKDDKLAFKAQYFRQMNLRYTVP